MIVLKDVSKDYGTLEKMLPILSNTKCFYISGQWLFLGGGILMM
jgi:hypothetical protein